MLLQSAPLATCTKGKYKINNIYLLLADKNEIFAVTQVNMAFQVFDVLEGGKEGDVQI